VNGKTSGASGQLCARVVTGSWARACGDQGADSSSEQARTVGETAAEVPMEAEVVVLEQTEVPAE
jgi:hypothetical protein